MRDSSGFSWCNSPDHIWRPSRREFLYVGLVGTLGLSLGNLFRLQAAASSGKTAAKEGVAKSIINIFLPGGMAAQESFDPKMLAPIEYRGPLGTVKTKLDGVHFSEFMKETAKVADKITVVRSMTHGEADHDRGTHNMFTGLSPQPRGQHPEHGQRGQLTNSVRATTCRPTFAFRRCRTPSPAQATSRLAFGPFSLGGDPASPNFQVQDLTLPGGVDERASRSAAKCSKRSTPTSARMEKSDALDGDGHLLPPGVCDGQLGEAPARRST